jgi:hypothetical protein
VQRARGCALTENSHAPHHQIATKLWRQPCTSTHPAVSSSTRVSMGTPEPVLPRWPGQSAATSSGLTLVSSDSDCFALTNGPGQGAGQPFVIVPARHLRLWRRQEGVPTTTPTLLGPARQPALALAKAPGHELSYITPACTSTDDPQMANGACIPKDTTKSNATHGCHSTTPGRRPVGGLVGFEPHWQRTMEHKLHA